MNQTEHRVDRGEMYEEAEVIDEPSTDLERHEPPSVTLNLLGVTDPEEALTRFEAVATALDKRVRKRNLFTKMGKGEHLHVEAWTLLGSLLGVFPVPDGEPEPVEVNGVQGFKATVYAQTRSGERVGGGTAYCMRDEPTWAHRPTYALAGMAQTRAISRAMRAPLGFVAELAGYAATPADEMPAATPVKWATKATMAKIAKLIAKLEASQPTAESGGESWADAMRSHVGGKHGEKMSVEQAEKAIKFLTKADIPFG